MEQWRELERAAPLDAQSAGPPPPRILVAGIGNIFFGDDAFGVEVVRRIGRSLDRAADVVDFGIRGSDLVHALQSGYDGVVLVDALPRGEAPGTLYVVEPDLDAEVGGAASLAGHGIDAVAALRLVRALGSPLPRVRMVGCEPGALPDPATALEAAAMRLSPPVQTAAVLAVDLVESVVGGLADALRRRATAPPTESRTTLPAHAPHGTARCEARG